MGPTAMRRMQSVLPSLFTTGQPTLFDGLDARLRAQRRRWIVVCARDLRKLAARRKDFGVTADDTRQIAIRHGFATGAESNQRALSWFATVPVTARLRPTERTRMSIKRNAQRVYVLR